MRILSVDPRQLIDSANTLSALAERVTGEPALRYAVQSGQLGGEPLTSAIDALDEQCLRAMAVLTADAATTAANLRDNAARYVEADEAVAASLTSYPTDDRPTGSDH